MNKVEDLSGRKFGRLTVIERDLTETKGGSNWICQCECGNIKSVTRNNLLSGGTTSCGCARKGVNLKRLEKGQRFGRLSVVEMTEKNVEIHIFINVFATVGKSAMYPGHIL